MSRYARFRRATGRQRRSGDREFLAAVAVVVVLIVGFVGFALFSSLHETTRSCTVESKDRVAGQDGKSQMRVYTSDCGVFQVSDSLLKMTWNSADRYAALQAGQRYELTTVGFRIPVASTFPNVIDARPVGGGV